MSARRTSRQTRICVNDYAGHPFQIDLSRELHRRGYDVAHVYCTTNVTPRGDLSLDRGPGPRIIGLGTGKGFDKYNATRRLLAEIRYGLKSAWQLARQRPGVVLTSNVPIVSLAIIQLAAFVLRSRTVLWLQDFQAGLAALALGSERHPIVTGLQWLENRTVRSAQHVIAISEGFADEIRLLGVRADRVSTIENWAPIDELPLQPRVNPWAEKHDLVGGLVFLYSGTLGIKHRPESLLEIADDLSITHPEAKVVVVSEGVGADELANLCRNRPDPANILLLPFQDFADLPDVMASADVLVVLLELDAGRFSVPSKVLSYLCAGRPILGLVPGENPAASLIAERAEAGLVADSSDVLIKNARLLAEDSALRQSYGNNGREWAKANFSIARIADRFERTMFKTNQGRTLLS